MTLGVAYLTVLAHERNRQNQALQLRSQARVLNGLIDPTPEPPRLTRAELAREERSTLIEAAKDRWNAEIENAVRYVQTKDWSDVRESMEDTVARVLGISLEKSREGVAEAENRVGPKVQEAVDRSRAASRYGADQAAVGVNEATKKAIAGADHAAVKAREAAAATPGTIDAARGAVRDAVNKGLEKGKEAVAAVGSAIHSAESKVSEKVGQSEIEKALEQRYSGPAWADQSVEEALAERYTPIDEKDNSVLRGV